MNSPKSTLGEKLKTIGWAFGIAWNIDKKMMVLWFGLSATLSVLPAIALRYNRDIISTLSRFLSSGTGQFSDIVIDIIVLGVILTAVGLSGRINGDLLYMMMYDSYYLGMEEVLMKYIQRIDMKTFLGKDFKDEYNAVIRRAGSLTDFMSASCTLFSKLIGISSLLIVAFGVSKVIFLISLVYVVAALWSNGSFLENVRHNNLKRSEDEQAVKYFQSMPQTPGIAKEIRLYGTRNEIISQWQRAHRRIEIDEITRTLGLELRSLVSGVGFYLFMIGIIVYAITKVASGMMGADVFLMIYVLCQNISTAISGLAGGYLSMDYGLFSLERQRRFIAMVPDNNSVVEDNKLTEHDDHEVVFEAKVVSFSYGEDHPVLQGINLKIYKGEIVALVGLNGSGKSTFVKLLLQLYQPSKGFLYFYGKPFSAYQRGYISSRIGAFFQDFYLFHAKLFENVGFGDVKHINDEHRLLEALSKGGAEKLAVELPNGLSQMIGRDVDKEGASLSGGEKQKIAVARAHMSDKEIMIFDEPAAALDPIAEMEQFMAIKEKINGRTAILISHRVGFARMADRIIVLDNGRILEIGNHDDLIRRKGFYSNFYNQQAQWYDTAATAEVNR